MSHYPDSLEAALGQPLNFRPETLQAVRAFARSKPWKGTIAERSVKFQTLHAELAAAYEVTAPTLIFSGDGHGDSSASCYIPSENTIIIHGRLSVITFLHEWGHVLRGSSEQEACRWSLNLFRRCFPRSWGRLR